MALLTLNHIKTICIIWPYHTRGQVDLSCEKVKTKHTANKFKSNKVSFARHDELKTTELCLWGLLSIRNTTAINIGKNMKKSTGKV